MYQLNMQFKVILLLDSIRLLRLLPSEDKTAPIQCELFHYSLQESGRRTHPYEALSYVWGSLDNLHSVFIHEHNPKSGYGSTSGNDLSVTRNLHAALIRLRYPLFERIICIDAVCINQNNDKEKEQQIQFMVKIYGLANRVIVWLGDAAEDSDQALHWIRVAGGNKSKIPPINEAVQEAVIALLQRPWFRRIWVLQEVAAARHILIMCGPTEIDGYAFCLGVDSFQVFVNPHAPLQHFARSTTYLIRGAIFRSELSMGRSGSSSLGICPLGELVDMYRAHEATKCHDRVFALLGMSSDDLTKSKLLPDYSVPWEELLERLTKHLLGKEISVEIRGVDREIVVIRSKGCVLGTVLLEQKYSIQAERESVDVIFRNEKGITHLALLGSARSVRDGDLICLLQGTSSLTIIRDCCDHFEVIGIAVRLVEKALVSDGYVDGPKLSQSGIQFIHNLTLIWDWEMTLERSQHSKGYHRVLGLQAAIQGYQTAFGIQHPYTLEDRCDMTPLSWAAENGHVSVVHLLLAKDDSDLNLKDSRLGRTPLSWAVGRGHETVVKLLLQTGQVDVNSKDKSGQTPLLWAAREGHETVVKLLLQASKVDVNSKDGWAANEATVKLLQSSNI
ncbi:hypothetical protein COCMIDRAFT_35895 [Bipolaris oryzae ATCC 44560]|uniref:Heterokaryon incompatibility domain-containing protein n=1 Tax=Bipolaris oryzae ATCC 44560 TaxID=930090 RepID=W6Z453_COCMI|nr:uncharacterized protein COCMIDRAFT_35895 [Bipolaris oryzae ATCC 44560]EUC46542.1 hypothetical protein COCMIDRAFT_35895 [Bipolaris oryzae ATCC 44560]